MNAAETVVTGELKGRRAALAARASEAFAATRQARDKLRALRPARPILSTIEKDAEVGAFLRERFKSGLTLAELHAACVERFGAGRAPSAGRIGVFRQRVRR